DLEVATAIPDTGTWRNAASLGITCAALASRDGPEPRFFQGVPQMSREECVALVQELKRLASEGYTLVTWNGTGFDFAVLARESGLSKDCAELALAHIDLM